MLACTATYSCKIYSFYIHSRTLSLYFTYLHPSMHNTLVNQITEIYKSWKLFANHTSYYLHLKIYWKAISFSSSSFNLVCMLACSNPRQCHTRKSTMYVALHAGMHSHILLQNIFIFSSLIVLCFLHASMHLAHTSSLPV